MISRVSFAGLPRLRQASSRAEDWARFSTASNCNEGHGLLTLTGCKNTCTKQESHLHHLFCGRIDWNPRGYRGCCLLSIRAGGVSTLLRKAEGADSRPARRKSFDRNETYCNLTDPIHIPAILGLKQLPARVGRLEKVLAVALIPINSMIRWFPRRPMKPSIPPRRVI